MINWIVIYAFSSVEIFIFLTLLRHSFNTYKIRNKLEIEILFFLLLSFLLGRNRTYVYFSLLMDFTLILISWIYVCIIKRRIKLIDLSLCILWRGYMVCTDFILFIMLESIRGNVLWGYNLQYNMGLDIEIFQLITKILNLIVIILIRKKLQIFIDYLNHRKGVRNATLMVIVVIDLFFYWILLERVQYVSISYQYFALSLLFIFALLLVGYSAVRGSREETRIVQIRNSMLEKINENSMELLKKNAVLAHDAKNHLNSIYQLLVNEQYIQIEKYIQNVIHPVSIISDVKWTGNLMLDLLLSMYQDLAQDKGIKYEIKTVLESDLFMPQEDLCSIFSNLLENAIEASEIIKVNDNRWIRIKIIAKKGLLFVKISNNHQNILVNKGYGLETTKENKLSHGWGMLSVESVVKKYAGDMEVNYTTSVFEVIISIFNTEKSTYV